MHKSSAVICLLAAILITGLCIHLDTTPVQADPSPADYEFSQKRALEHLRQIAGSPHSTGTPGNAVARAYILNTCAALGLDTSVGHAIGVSPQGGGAVAANVYNIVARLKGSASSKTVLIAAHYDSQPNAGGAGDDGAGCAAMLETARILKTGRPLMNDIVFLFTDGEEDGLLGANAFVRENPLLKDIGIMLNFDNRGGAGPILLSETNPGNGWVIDGFARSGAHHNASSLNYEVYKRLPNSTDYTPFKSSGIAGLNNAFIDGFVHYHSISDIPANLDPGTLQEEGDNMVAEARYFGNVRIGDTKAPDLTFFNIIGGWFVRYPASLNIVLLVLVNILLVTCLIIGFTGRQVRIPGLAFGFLAFPLMLGILYFVSDWALKAIRLASPLYEGYYSNAYHPGYYFLALAALGITLFSVVYRWLLSRFSMPSLLGGTLVFLVILLDFLYMIMPTAIYFLCIPLLVLLAGGAFTFFRRPSSSAARQPSPGISLLLLIPAILLLAPIYAMFFVAFDLQATSAAVPALIGILLGLALPLLAAVFRESRWLLPAGAFSLCIVAAVLGLVQNRPSAEQPFKTNLVYVINADQGKARWVSLSFGADRWNKQFFPNAQLLPIATVFPGGPYHLSHVLTNDAPLQDFPAPTLTVKRDTIENDRRLLSLHLQASPGANSVHLIFDANNLPEKILLQDSVQLDDSTHRRTGFHWLMYKGITAAGLDLQLQLSTKDSARIDVLSRSIGLPAGAGFKGFPPGVIPGPENYSNATIAVKKFSF